MDLSLLSSLNAERQARRAAILVTDIGSGEQRLVRGADVAGDPLAGPLAERLASGKSGMIEGAQGQRLFLTVQVPPARLMVIGAVHISQALAPMARLLGHDVIVVDPRTAFATPERFGDVQVLAEWPQEAMARLGVDRYTGVVALTHDPKIDDPGLAIALRQECFYVGALGSRKTHAARLQRLSDQGFNGGQLARIHAPIGLPIGAVSPAEIALAILAEITAALRQKPDRATAGAA
jgi:xanthine dehydrogenase accessory factor